MPAKVALLGLGVGLALAGCAARTSARTEVPPLYTDTSVLLSEARAVVADFHNRVRAAGAPLTFVPEVILKSESGLLYYDPDRRQVVVPHWPDLSTGARSLYAQIGGQFATPEQAFASGNWLYLVHELGHQVLDESGAHAKQSRYENESAASAWALAYWRARGQHERLEFLRQLATDAVSRMQSSDPAPADADRIAYFNEHYRELGSDPPAYAWYQIKMLVDLFAVQPERNIEALSKALPQALPRP